MRRRRPAACRPGRGAHILTRAWSQEIETRETYAIKKTKKQFRSEHDRDHALAEVRTVMAIGEHENIVQCVGAWQADGHLFVQMEFCSLGNLKHYASRVGLLMEEELWCVLHDCSKGLKHIHDREFLHLDLKPENIFLTEEGLLKIGDFGVTVHQGCFEDGNEGDSVYLALEVLDGEIGPAADIFSLGIMLFELAAQVDLPVRHLLPLSPPFTQLLHAVACRAWNGALRLSKARVCRPTVASGTTCGTGRGTL